MHFCSLKDARNTTVCCDKCVTCHVALYRHRMCIVQLIDTVCTLYMYNKMIKVHGFHISIIVSML